MASVSAEVGQGSRRWRAARVLAWLLAVTSAVVFFGIVDLTTLPGWTDPAYEWQVPLDASWGSLFTFVIAGAYAWVALRPASPWPAVVQLGVTAVALGVSAALGQDARPAWVGLGVAGTAAILVWLTRRASGPVLGPMRPSWALGVLALAGMPLCPGGPRPRPAGLRCRPVPLAHGAAAPAREPEPLRSVRRRGHAGVP